ncbi:PREDICTED: ectonucleoside triphosphate diphosphohydrolase 5 [Ceratosolen solmsi marchali]|uniref:Ectonucleoside triphosphate diphosphohydrolase 5 n=1 Tax=Ceratosolen solmsi marchali TaxID=326594 RepID=A0AAJ7E2H2_9HYME|nr:PREDICTED: ectonucleoside triphosphate diphosphohydrolase 5 [Ceratosolen solmsi marchali]
MVVRQRQINKNEGVKDDTTRNIQNFVTEQPMGILKKQRWCKRKYLRIIIVLCLLFLIYIGLANNTKTFQISSKAIDNLAIHFNLHKPFYVIIIDAGSTASRVVAFTFHMSIVNGQLILDDELFFETKPGLSSFVKKPNQIEKSLNILLQKAKLKIPQQEWSRTPLYLRATAGLRLLSNDESQKILEECKKVLNMSGFYTSDDSVAIMEGSDEGIFSWFTVNFLLERFSKTSNNIDHATNTISTFDLGGGSTQITFALTPNVIEKKAKELAIYKEKIFHINAFDRNMSIFTESFLGMGLMAARKEILMHPDNHKNQTKKINIASPNLEVIEIYAECINPIISGVEWTYDRKKYIVKGPINGMHKIIKTQNFAGTDEVRPIVRFSTCLDIIKKVINANIPHDLSEFLEHDIYAFSYYFDRATEAGLIDPFKGGIISIESIYKTARETCEYPNTEQPFMCLDLSFIYVLLHEGFGLDKKSNIFMQKKINGHELSWALGAAFNILQKDMKYLSQ